MEAAGITPGEPTGAGRRVASMMGGGAAPTTYAGSTQLQQPAAAAPSENKLKVFCFSHLGVSLLMMAAIFLLLLMLQPPYIFTKNTENYEFRSINYGYVVGISVGAGVLVFLLPMLIHKKAPCPP